MWYSAVHTQYTNEFVRHKSPYFTTHKLRKSPDYIP